MILTPNKRMYLIDGYAMVYRAHFAMIRNPLITSTGLHTSALFGFVNAVFKLLRDESPDYLVAVFDGKEKTFRHDMYKEYNSTREKMPDELQQQLPHMWRLVEEMGIPRLQIDGFEADDIIGTLALEASKAGLDCRILSGDKDFMQLVSNQILLQTPAKGGESIIYGPTEVEKKWGVPPERIIDLFGLMGDSSDNVPGVPGVGEKTAVKLIKEYGDFENILTHGSEVKNKRVRKGLMEGVDLARLSRKLVTIKTDVEIPIELESMKIGTFNFKEMDKLFRELEFFNLQSQLNNFSGENGVESRSVVDKKYSIIKSRQDLDVMIKKLKLANLISMDIESTSTNPMLAEIVGFSFSIEANSGWYVPILFPEKKNQLFGEENDLHIVLELLQSIFEDKNSAKCGQNIKYDMIILKRHGINVKGIEFDTMIAAHILNPESRSYKLDYLSEEYLQYNMQPISDLIGTGKDQKRMNEVPLKKTSFYATEDSDVCLQLKQLLDKELEDVSLSHFYRKVEIPLIEVLVDMEFQGVFVDRTMMKNMSNWMETKLDNFSREIHSLAEENFNINSPKQLSDILFDKLGLPKIKKRSTNVSVLESLKSYHPLPEKILEYRKFQKLKSTYVDAIPEMIHPETGRIHSSLIQTVASTGRLSSRNPNFQNIPIRTDEGKEIRKAFRAQKNNWSIFSADYSQVELRIMAHLSGDEQLHTAFNKNEDVHSHTASNIFQVPLENVHSDMRRIAKIVNFGIMYGAGPYRMSQELNISMVDAKGIIETYFKTYPGIKSFIDSTVETAKANGVVSTLLGRRRNTQNIMSSRQQIVNAEIRAAINMPIQGTAAEMIKLAMLDINKTLKNDNYQSRMILQIHDELLFESPKDEISELEKMVKDKMVNAMPLEVPLVVDCGQGISWFDAH